MNRFSVPVRWLLCFPTLFSLLACEKISLDADVDGSTSSAYVVPVGHGLGTQECPLTPKELIAGVVPQTVSECWVMGYAVGSTYRTLNNAVFDVPTTYSSNILLSYDSLCTDVSECVAVELTTNAMKEKFSLCYYPDGHRQFVVLCGTYGTYFSKTGLKKATQGYWIQPFDISTIASLPEEWEDVEIEF